MTNNDDIIKNIYLIKTDLDDCIHKVDNAAFNMGLPGIALFYYYCYLHSRQSRCLDTFTSLIDRSINILSSITVHEFQQKYRTDSIDNHLSGFGRFLIFSQSKLDGELDIEEILNELDDLLIPLMYSKIQAEDFDIDSGALASGNYFLARFRQSGSSKYRDLLENLVTAIDNSSKRTNTGIYWVSPTLNNNIYLGLSHGSGMIINFLSKMVDLNIQSDNSINIINQGAAFILSNKRNQIRGLFPHCYFFDEKEKSEETQFSQCYGDLGIGYALLKAGKSIDDKKLYGESLEILQECATRKNEDNLTQDAGIIYGASGVACVFDELSQITNNITFEQASKYWFNEITSYAIENRYGKPMFKSMFSLSDVNYHTSFGWGLAGIGAALIRSLDRNKYPCFNELLMIGP